MNTSGRDRRAEGRVMAGRLLPTTLVLLAGALLVAGLAFACVPKADISVEPRSGAAGTSVRVTGSSFSAGTVEIRWGSSSGALLASAAGPAFTTSVAIPSAAAGVYYVVGVARDGEGNIVAQQSAPFEVISPSPAPGGGAGGESGGPGNAGARAPGGEAVTAPGARPTVETPGRVPSRRVSGRADGPRRGGQSDGSRSRGTGQTPASRNDSDTPQVVKTPSGQKVFAGSVAPSSDRDGRGRADSSRGRSKTTTRASQRSVASDLWSGFGRTMSPSLGSVDGSATSARSPGGLAVALLGAGLMALFCALAIADRRRRVRTHASEDR